MKLLAWLKSEPVLVAAWALALISAFFVPPDAAYADYLDTRTLALLFCLMAVMAALQGAGLFQRITGNADHIQHQIIAQLPGNLLGKGPACGILPDIPVQICVTRMYGRKARHGI